MRVDATAFVRSNISGLERYSFELIRAACRLQPQLEAGLTFVGFRGDNFVLVETEFPAAKIQRLPLPRKLYTQFYKYLWPLHWWYKTTELMLYTNFVQFPFRSRRALVVVHDLAYLDIPDVVQPRNRWFLKRFVPRSLTTSGVQPLAVSEFTKRRLLEEYRLPTEPVIVANGIDYQRFATPSQIDVRRHYGLPQHYILFLGTLEPRKNLLQLLAAYEQLDEHLSERYGLVLAGGGGWQNETFEQRLAELEAKGQRIIRTGFVADEDLPALYQQASLFTFLSDYEGTGLPLLEAMAAGTPVLGSDIPPHRDVSEGTVRLVDQTDSRQIAMAMTDLLQTPPQPKQLRDARAQAARQSWDVSAEQLFKLIDKLEP